MTKNLIPTINISSIINQDFSSKKSIDTIKKIKKACIDIGFFQVIGHGINKKNIKNTCNVGNKFFNSPENNKKKLSPKKWNHKNKNIYRGYFPNDVNGKEGLDIGDLRVTKSFSNKINNRYIEYIDLNKSFNKNEIKILSDYFDRIFNLSETLFKCIIIIYKKDPSLSKLVFSRLKTLSTLRFNYYPKQASPVEISKQDGVPLGCETHVDSGIFTILYQDKCGGLQVQNRKNKRWYDVPFNRNALVVNTGRALEFLSKNKFRATNHRVLWNRRERLSVPFFFEPSFDFKMNKDFLTNKRSKQNNVEIYEKFLNKSLKKFIEYQR
tara:strand:+ start:119 stop:1090 length:972 start_codon:yes stop_codon:yes gene_type:complete